MLKLTEVKIKNSRNKIKYRPIIHIINPEPVQKTN